MQFKRGREATAKFATLTAAKSPVLNDAERKNFAETHGVNHFIALDAISNVSWPENVNQNIIRRTMLNVYDPNKDFCQPCNTRVSDERHFETAMHATSIAAQPFRLNATCDNLNGYQRWLADHALGRKWTAAKGVRVRMDFIRTEEGVNYWFSKLADAGQDIPLIYGKKEVGEVELKFRVQYWDEPDAGVKRVRIIPTGTTDDGYSVHRDQDITRGRNGIYQTRIQCNMMGVKYYTVQVWVAIERENMPTSFFPLCCEVKISWHDTLFEQELQQALMKVPQKLKTEGETPLSTIPNSAHNPPREAVQRFQPVQRVHKGIDLNHPSLAPIFDYWIKQDIDDFDEADALAVREKPILTGDHPETSAAALGTSRAIDIETPMTKENVDLKCWGDLLGQEQYNEDKMDRAECLTLDLINQNNVPPEADINLDDNDSIHLRVTVPTVAYSSLNTSDSASFVRIANSQWNEKYLAKVLYEENQPLHPRTTLVLQLSTAALSTQPTCAS